MGVPKSASKTDVGQCFEALIRREPEQTLVASKVDKPIPEFQFSGRYTPPSSHHKGHCPDRPVQHTFHRGVLDHMPRKVSLRHTEISQQQIRKNCLITTLRIIREGKKLPERMQRSFHTYFLADTKGRGLRRGFSQFDTTAVAKRHGHQTFSDGMTARRALSHTLCMLKAGYAVPLGVSYWNKFNGSRTGVNHWIVAYGYEFVETQDGLRLKILAHDVGIIKNGKLKDDRHVEFLVDTTGRIYKPGQHDRKPYVRGGQEVTAIGMPFEIKPLLPTT